MTIRDEIAWNRESRYLMTAEGPDWSLRVERGEDGTMYRWAANYRGRLSSGRRWSIVAAQSAAEHALKVASQGS